MSTKPKIHQLADLRALPPELAALTLSKIWVPWKLMPTSSGGWTKQPYADGRQISWGPNGVTYSFDEVCTIVERGGADGIGITLSANAKWAAIDVDHCTDPNGNLWAWAENMLAWVQKWMSPLPYIEMTIGGAGLRVIGSSTSAHQFPGMVRKGDILPNGKLDVTRKPAKGAAGFELYRRPKARFITLSGLGQGNPNANIDPLFEWINVEYMLPIPPVAVDLTTIDYRQRPVPDEEAQAIPGVLQKLIDGPLTRSQLERLDKSAEFQSVVWRLINLNYSAIDIMRMFEGKTEGIAQRYLAEGRLPNMIQMSYAKKIAQDRANLAYLESIIVQPDNLAAKYKVKT